MRRRRRRDLPRADLRRAHRGRMPLGHAAVAHRHRESRIPGAVRDGRGVLDDGTGRRRRRSRSTAAARKASSGGSRDATLGDGMGSRPTSTLDPVPQRDLAAAHDAAHRARVGAHPGHRVHPRCVRRVLPPLSEDGAARSPTAMPPEELGQRGPPASATQIDPVHLWAVPELHADRPQRARGRRVCSTPKREVADLAPRPRLLGARRARVPLRRRHASGVGCRRGGDPVSARTSPTSWPGAGRCATTTSARRISRLNALVTSYLFLLWFDTRSGYQDTGPYRLDDGRVLLLRSFNRLGVSHFPWSNDVSTRHALLRRARRVRARRRRTARDRLRHVGDEARGLLAARRRVRPLRRHRRSTRADRRCRRRGAGRRGQGAHSARCTGRSRRWNGNAKIDAGAYVYFTFLRPFADARGRRARLDRAARQPRPVPVALDDRQSDAAADRAGPGRTYYPPVP